MTVSVTACDSHPNAHVRVPNSGGRFTVAQEGGRAEEGVFVDNVLYSANVEEHQVNQDDPVEYHVPLGQRGTEATRLLRQALAYIARRRHVLQTLKRPGNSILVLRTPHDGVQSLAARMEKVAVDAHELWKCVEDVRVPLPAVVLITLIQLPVY